MFRETGPGRPRAVKRRLVRPGPAAEGTRRGLADLHDPEGWTPLMFAVVERQAATVEDLLRAGADVNARAADGSTALMKASLWGDPEIVAILLGHGADPEARDADGWTAIEIAAAAGHREVQDLLRQAASRRTRGGQ